MLYDALYARQSIEKKDSISVDSQLEYCRYETHGMPYIEYTDKGFSGKDLNRPGFEKMMSDIMSGKIRRVIVYKLDRVSRSILDFASMMEVFEKYHVEFVSSTEKFDTSTPIGRAMLNICIVFAQLERETIQKRVADAYYTRSKRGFYMGGRIPYGFCLRETVIDAVHTSMYEEVPEESCQLKLIFSMYADSPNSLGDIVRYLNEHHMSNLRGGIWNTARISEMLRNPVYVQADIDVYRFFQEQGANICSPIEDFDGSHACYLYSSSNSAASKRKELADKEVVLAPHCGFISSSIWLACRRRSMKNRRLTKTCKPVNSWLAGKVKCGNCGYALTVKKANTKWGRYFVCSQSGKQGGCKGAGCTIYAEVLENYMSAAIEKKLLDFACLSDGEDSCIHRNAEKKLRMIQLDEEISGLLSRVGSAEAVLLNYINEKLEELDREKKGLEQEMRRDAHIAEKDGQITNHSDIWKDLLFEDRQTVADILIDIIEISDGEMKITWNI